MRPSELAKQIVRSVIYLRGEDIQARAEAIVDAHLASLDTTRAASLDVQLTALETERDRMMNEIDELRAKLGREVEERRASIKRMAADHADRLERIRALCVRELARKPNPTLSAIIGALP